MNLRFLETTKDHEVIFKGHYMEVLVTQEHKDNNMFYMSGSDYNILGLFTFRVKETENSNIRTFTLTLPATISTSPSDSEVRKMVLDSSTDGEEENVTVLKYNNSDTFINDLNITENSGDAAKFVNLFHAGKVPNAISYNDLYDLYMSALSIHGVGTGAPSSIIEIIISGICRVPGDLPTPFRAKIGKNPDTNPNSYQTINMKTLPRITSTFAAISFEDINNSINASLYRDGNVKSPIEDSIKY